MWYPSKMFFCSDRESREIYWDLRSSEAPFIDTCIVITLHVDIRAGTQPCTERYT